MIPMVTWAALSFAVSPEVACESEPGCWWADDNPSQEPTCYCALPALSCPLEASDASASCDDPTLVPSTTWRCDDGASTTTYTGFAWRDGEGHTRHLWGETFGECTPTRRPRGSINLQAANDFLLEQLELATALFSQARGRVVDIGRHWDEAILAQIDLEESLMWAESDNAILVSDLMSESRRADALAAEAEMLWTTVFELEAQLSTCALPQTDPLGDCISAARKKDPKMTLDAMCATTCVCP